MPEFVCRIAAPSGEVFDKTYSGVDEAAVRSELEAQDLLILGLKRRNPVVQSLLRSLRLTGSIPPRDFLSFNQELRALIRAGLPIVPSLNILLERRKNKVFRNALIDIRDRVKGGESLSDAFSEQGELFPTLYSTSLASGERSGELHPVDTDPYFFLSTVAGTVMFYIAALPTFFETLPFDPLDPDRIASLKHNVLRSVRRLLGIGGVRPISNLEQPES